MRKREIKLPMTPITEETFVRQIDIPNNEADDLISYYCQISEDETKVIFSDDKDLTQLISDKVSIYSPSQKKVYKKGDKIKIDNIEIPHQNVVTYKILSTINKKFEIRSKIFFKSKN